ncbi:MAG: glycosyltransferase, partial [Bacilli bacterium]|nr:glycosyltransferase [Bacilli bacterium]
MILSIVIPIYNVEQYVEKCLLSCINQKGVSKNDYEIIIVNDGSKDNSMKIVHEIISSLATNTPVTIINQNNMGLSEARNTGLRHAKGDYVWFVDSDDWIENDSVENIIQALKEVDVDILQMPYKLIYEGSQKEDIEHVKKINIPITGKECLKITRLPNLAQSRILKKSFLMENELNFKPGILHEDAEFKPRAIWNARYIKTLNKPFYNYLKREKDSITASFTIRNAEGRWIGVKS